MGKRLEKTEYLLQIEGVLKKYGYTRMYCFDKFTGVKEPGLMFMIEGEKKGNIISELCQIVDPTWDLDDYDALDITGVGCLENLSEKDWMQGSTPVYDGGEFYANEG